MTHENTIFQKLSLIEVYYFYVGSMQYPLINLSPLSKHLLYLFVTKLLMNGKRT